MNPAGLLLPCLAVIPRYANGGEEMVLFASALHTKKSHNASVLQARSSFAILLLFFDPAQQDNVF